MLASLILVITKHLKFHVHIQVTTAIAMNGVAGTVSTLSVAGNVERNVTDLNAMKFVTRNCVVVTGVLDSAERDA